MVAECLCHRPFDFVGGDTHCAGGLSVALLQERVGDIVTIARTVLVGVGRSHSTSSSKMRPVRIEGDARSFSCRSFALAASLACTASNSERSRMASCSPG